MSDSTMARLRVCDTYIIEFATRLYCTFRAVGTLLLVNIEPSTVQNSSSAGTAMHFGYPMDRNNLVVFARDYGMEKAIRNVNWPGKIEFGVCQPYAAYEAIALLLRPRQTH